MGPVPRRLPGRPAISVSVATGAVRWMVAAIPPPAGLSGASGFVCQDS